MTAGSTAVYLDASALVPIAVVEPSSALIDSFVLAHSGDLLVSELAAAEVGSAISRLVRMRLLTEEQGRRRLADFDAWRATNAAACDLEAADVRVAAAYVRRFELMLRTPDALHAAICHRLGCALVTLDTGLERAALDLGIQAVNPRLASSP
jgi:predicted nucleic acid-binding protein